MKNSNFIFDSAKLKKFNFEINDNYKKTNNIQLDISPIFSHTEPQNNSVITVLKIIIFDKENNSDAPFFIEIEMEGLFHWENADENDINIFLETNAPAILYTYMRPYISNATSGAGFPPLLLPLINFTK